MIPQNLPFKISDEDKAYIERFRLMDDDFMRMVFDGDKESAAVLLHAILEREDIIVEEVAVQREYKSAAASGRTIRLDIWARDDTGRVYDIEVQRSDAGASEKRARFHSSALDSRLLKAGEHFGAMADSYVIFITENDIYKAGLPMYHVERQIKELARPFADGAHIIYVNGQYRNAESSVGRLMHDFSCTDPDDMFSPVLAERVRYFKQEEGGIASMCRMMEDMRKEVADKAMAQGMTKGISQALLTYMRKHNCDAETAMDEFEIASNDREALRPLLN